MKEFNPLYEVYRRDDKNIIAQGTKEECDKLSKKDWYYSVRPVKQILFSEHEMHLNMQYYMEYCDLNGYVTPMEWIEKHKHF